MLTVSGAGGHVSASSARCFVGNAGTAARFLPVLMALGVGVSLNNAKAVIEAIISHVKRKPSEFVRTPKYGANGKVRTAWSGNTVFTFKRLALPIVEIAFGVYMLSFIFISLKWDFARSSIPFLTIFAGGYFYVGFSSLWVLWKMHQDVQEQAELAATTTATA